MNSSREVVITGLGVVSPIGIGHEPFWQSLLEGHSGVRIREPFGDTDLPFRLAAPISDFEPKQYVKPRKAMKIMCAPIQFGCGAAQMAFEHANLDRDAIDSDRFGTVFGTETFFADPSEVADVFRKCIVDQDYQHERWGEFAMREIQPLWMLKYLPNMAASHISIGMDARGPSNSICQGEASGALAIIEAADLIQRGIADIVVTGGTGSQMSLSAMIYRGVDLLSKGMGDPAAAVRPFGKDRDGNVCGEGAGALVLESREHAEARNAHILASLKSWTRSYCSIEDDSFVACLTDNLVNTSERGGHAPRTIAAVSAHAGGSIRADRLEATAIQAAVGDKPVVANKGHFGSLGPGCSAIETVAAVLSLEHGVLPPTLNCHEVDPLCPVNVSPETQKISAGQPILKSCFSANGQIASLLLATPD